MKTIFIVLSLTFILLSIVKGDNSLSKENSEISKEFFNGFFRYHKGENWTFNKKCLNEKLNSEYANLEKVILAKWLDLGDVLRMMSNVEEKINSVCDFPELKDYNQRYTEQINNGNYMKNVSFRAIQIAQIIRDLYDSAYRLDPEHIGTTMAKISSYLVYVDDSLKFLE